VTGRGRVRALHRNRSREAGGYEPKRPVRATEELENDAVSPLFLAAVESVEEAVYNSLTRATTVTGHRGAKAEALPIDRLKAALAARAEGQR
jgi:L-aminopeptidase/D-esterase-like protein